MDHARGMPIKIHSHKAGKLLPGFIKAITLRIVANHHPAVCKPRHRNLKHQAAMQTVNNNDIELFIQAIECLPHKDCLLLKPNRRMINLDIAPRNTLDFLNPARVCPKGSHISGYPPPRISCFAPRQTQEWMTR